MTKFSIVIPFFWKREAYLRQFLTEAAKMDYKDFEVLMVCDRPWSANINVPDFARVIYTDKQSQGEKFDAGAKQAQGEILAFVGDDTYPRADWLSKALPYFDDPDVDAVGGPGLTPPDDSPLQQASGFVYSSPFVTGPTASRHSVRGKARYCEDLPGTNLFIRGSSFRWVGGFDNRFRSGEDSYICTKMYDEGMKMLYAPDVIVYHHRRNLLKGYLRQIWNVGTFRGYFAKTFGSINRRPMYFIDSIAVFIGIPFLIAVPVLGALSLILGFLISLISGTVGFWTTGSRNFKAGIYVGLAIWLTHLTYGIAFVEGLLLKHDSPVLFYKEGE